MKLGYYPGCSLHSTGREFDESLHEVCKALDIELAELPDWNCCGASSGGILSHEQSVGLSARNLGIAAEMGLPVLVPCAACYNRMKTAQVDLAEDKTLPAKLDVASDALDIPVVNMIELLDQPEVTEKLKAAMTDPLTGMKPAAYYGCLLLRPPSAVKFDDPEQPSSFERVLALLGAEPIEWYAKTECCGASLSATRQDIVSHLVDDIVARARKAGATSLVTACPLCQMNLETRQTGDARSRMPVFFITELVGIALGIPGPKLGLSRHLVDVRSAMSV
jgi:heterodisulfide reductase subunit B